MRVDISFQLGGSRAVIETAFDGGRQGRWNGQAFKGPDAATVAFLIITRHRAPMSARIAVDE